MEIPLFPLRTVLFPGGPLQLRIFEQRYLDMISRCLKADSPFGVLLIKEGSETGRASTFDIGTLAHITDWYQGSDGLLGVTGTGTKRFRSLSFRRENDGLMFGEVELLPPPSACKLPEEYKPLAKILRGVIDNLGSLYEDLEKYYDDAGWVSYRFAEILPINVAQKQSCLEIDDPIQRIDSMRAVLDMVRL
ncbi:MAG: LON peptidase substrate-binding domain-containing protein [Woeseiaceae bacterium]|nr:LON peptidase substrate-binding domain-containing protein [Woeseiaceae bacterium]